MAQKSDKNYNNFIYLLSPHKSKFYTRIPQKGITVFPLLKNKKLSGGNGIIIL